jgi:NDP-hexose-3-ketoreductase
MDNIIKIGVLGVANIAVRSVIPSIKDLPNHFQIKGIASRNNQKASQILNVFETKYYEGYESLLDDEGIDAVYIPLPNALHAKWVEFALLRGKHVLVEKSLGCSLEEVTNLTKLAKDKGLVILENFQFRFHPQLQLIKDCLTNGKIGEIRSLRVSFGFPPFIDRENIRYNPELGGGALLDAGAYTTKISQILLGEDLKVKASSLNFAPGYPVDIWGGAYLHDEVSGAFSEIAFGFDNFYQCGIEIWGSKGLLKTNRLFTAPDGYESKITIETKSGEEVLVAEPANHFKNILKYFYQLITTKQGVDQEYAQNLDQARLLQDIKIQANVR